jgi:tRNA U54 and U55 pseudouridine synthase Pus10
MNEMEDTQCPLCGNDLDHCECTIDDVLKALEETNKEEA